MRRKPTLLVLFVLAACGTDFTAGQAPGDMEAGAGDDAAFDAGGSVADAAACDGAPLDTDPNNCGSCGHACAIGEYCAARACTPGCAGAILYVANDGNDENDGCTLHTPKRTISAAIGYAASLRALGHTIHVCHGTYPEGPLTLNYPVKIEGGYDCATGARSQVTDGVFDPNEATVVTYGTAVVANAPYTLSLALPASTNAGDAGAAPTSVDGLSIQGPPLTACSGSLCATQGGSAIVVNGAAPVAITNDYVTGGATVGPANSAAIANSTLSFGSNGVLVAGNGSVEIAHSKIYGGSGSGTSSGSLGIFVMPTTTAPLSIHDLYVNGGTGHAQPATGVTSRASAAVYIDAANTTAIDSARFDGGVGITDGDGLTTFGTVGIQATNGAVLSLTNSWITAGTTSCPNVSCETVGVLLSSAPNAVVRKNRIYGGDVTQGTGYAVGVYVTNSTGVSIVNDMVNAGGENSAGLARTTALVLNGSSKNLVIVDNTFQLGPVSPAPAITYGVFISNTGITGVTLDDNLFFGGSPSSAERAFYFPTCGLGFASIADNAFVSVDLASAPVINPDGGACQAGSTVLPTVAAFDNYLQGLDGGSDASGDFAIEPSCAQGEIEAGTCITPAGCTTFTNCITSTLAVPSTLKTMALLSDGGAYQLAPTADCRVRAGALDHHAIAPDDLYGNARPIAASIGAHQADAGGCP